MPWSGWWLPSSCTAPRVCLPATPITELKHPVSCLTNTLLDPPADFRAGQGAPTRHSGYYVEEAQRRPARKDAAQRVRYFRDRTLRGHHENHNGPHRGARGDASDATGTGRRTNQSG